MIDSTWPAESRAGPVAVSPSRRVLRTPHGSGGVSACALVWLARVSEGEMSPHVADLHFRVYVRKSRDKRADQELADVSEGRVAHKPPTDAAGRCKIVERVRLGDV